MSRKSLFSPIWAALACLGVLLTGCSKEEEPAPQQAVNTPRGTAASSSGQSVAERTAAEVARELAKQNGGTAAGEVDPEADYPAELADWSDDDYRNARKINHSRLKIAVKERADKTEDSSADAKFWLELLEIKPASQGRDPDFSDNTDPGAALAANEEQGLGAGKNDGDGGQLSTANDAPIQQRVAVGDAGPSGGATNTPATNNDPPVDESKMGKGSAQEIVKALTDASAANTTEESVEALSAVLAGKLNNGTPDDVMVGFVLEEIKDSKREDQQQLMFEALLMPGKLRESEEDGKLTALQLQGKVFELLKGAKLSAMKKTLAEQIGDAEPSEAANTILDFLLEDDFDNLEAQVILYQNGEVTDEARNAELRDLLASYSKSAFDRLMGLTSAPAAAEGGASNNGGGGNGSGRGVGGSDGGDGAGSSQTITVPGDDEPLGGAGTRGAGGNRGAGNAPRRNNPGIRAIALTDDQVKTVAESLWTEEFEAAILDELNRGRTLEGAGDTMNIAGVMPMHAIRRKLAAMVKDNWQDGAQALADRGMFTNIMHEPGMLLVSKSAPTDIPKNFNPSGPAPTGGSRLESFEENKKKYEWFSSIYEQVDTMMKLYGSSPGTKDSLTGIQPPVPLYAGSNVTGAFEADWPEEISRKAGDAQIDMLKVQYIRAESDRPINHISGHYSLKLRGEQSYPLVNNGVWLNKTETDLEKGITRSTDIFIRPGTSGGGGGAGGSGGAGRGVGGGEGIGGVGGGQQNGATVEILVVETPAIVE